MVNDLDYADITCPVSKLDNSKTEQKIMFTLMYFVMKKICFILFIYQLKNWRLHGFFAGYSRK